MFYTIESRTLSPHILVLRIPVVGRAMLEKGNLLISMLGMASRSWYNADSFNIPNTSRASRVGIFNSNLKVYN